MHISLFSFYIQNVSDKDAIFVVVSLLNGERKDDSPQWSMSWELCGSSWWRRNPTGGEQDEPGVLAGRALGWGDKVT